MPAEPGDYLTQSIATENSHTQRVDDPSRLGVELVQTVLEKFDLCRRRIRSHDQLWSRHHVAGQNVQAVIRTLSCKNSGAKSAPLGHVTV